ncbi:hypothetical protein AAZX31_11G120800 [Glycine max]|uniref:Uncharacterized protein n=2 Tax=Glycine subgen. Soja TaxID=1462606 RepID=I1LJJ9_SOYBN|nr:uncharacterized protein LOC112998379 [Glycine max]KAG4973873.1 hypothetical protein JHK87_030694 [Glycine soja]KAG4988448.1 hypothetical protein JHK85_031431 [Glycine max]KAG4994055.1 hypothetical protein JHK86_030882 [Glycine max]KAG5124051.1 hypothetical protein JHK82_030788 [Glycine max]KAG5145468.1 hypothetical protein JHK84_031011 [Glycine max]|eukprot:XP_025980180.1 uncharacterized protein LOC112998379 [Glycine max]
MSAMVEVWVGELTKLREKVLARKPFLLSKAKEGSERNQEEKETQTAVVKRDTTNGTMSEATVCLLMDRFVPW